MGGGSLRIPRYGACSLTGLLSPLASVRLPECLAPAPAPGSCRSYALSLSLSPSRRRLPSLSPIRLSLLTLSPLAPLPLRPPLLPCPPYFLLASRAFFRRIVTSQTARPRIKRPMTTETMITAACSPGVHAGQVLDWGCGSWRGRRGGGKGVWVVGSVVDMEVNVVLVRL